MNWNEYKELAARTEALRPDLPMPPGSFRLMHAAAGLVTETQELADFTGAANLCEELGDCSWYFPIFVELLDDADAGLDMERLLACGPEMALQTFESCVQVMQRQSAELVDLIIKRHIVYGKPMENATFGAMRGALVLFIEAWVHACRVKGFSPEEAMEANIIKLEKRFPEKMFTQQRVFNRDTKAELSHMPGPAPQNPAKLTATEKAEAVNAMLSFGWRVPSNWQKRLGLCFGMPVEDLHRILITEVLPEAVQDLSRHTLHMSWNEDTLVVSLVLPETPAPTAEVYEQMFPTETEPTMSNEIGALPILTFESYKTLLRNELTEQEGRACTAAMAGALATQFGEAGAHCVKEGFKACYIKVLTDPSWLEDSYQLYQMLYPVGWTVDAVLSNLRKAGKP